MFKILQTQNVISVEIFILISGFEVFLLVNLYASVIPLIESISKQLLQNV